MPPELTPPKLTPPELMPAELMLADDRLLLMAADWRAAGHGLAIAFVIGTWGSSPRQIGSIMLIRDDNQIAGSVSGGCVEAAVIDAGLAVIESGSSQKLDFGVADETAWQVGLSCGGRISVLVMAVAQTAFTPELLDSAAGSLAGRIPVGFNLPVSGGVASLAVPPPTISQLDGDIFQFVQAPRPQVIIIGAVHITQHLATMASGCGFDVSIIDPRRTFATKDRFPTDRRGNVRLVQDWPDLVLADMVLDANTAVVTLTHDPKIDDAALVAILDKPLFHIACLGSKRTHAARLERLAAAGFNANATARIKGPAGYDIGAKTPAEIAVSVLAELVAAYRGRLHA